eukprot:CAMPEP_0184065930 /NCGR_PEP_ID=MMETSP0957-20130417/3105_1 /TAXON_ID=627963 /ORGANISM="Aplanochytrium sp, Strain PBS07" /LENGTH=117 /DNA_ID=CAMNT_0026363825 /DNA_START=373 /DNA_END=723 /DNA_ORIENTATION=-
MDGGFPSKVALMPVAQVTGAFVGLWYGFIILQVGVKVKLLRETKSNPKVSSYDIKIGNYKDKRLTTVNRTIGNTMEQAIPFLTSLWLCALFGDVDAAVFAGKYYVLFRALYPAAYYW